MPTTSVSPLAKKLLLKAGHTVALVNAPAGIAEKLKPLPDRATMSGAAAPRDAVLAFAKDQAELKRIAPQAIKAAKADSLLWISYPKGSAGTKTDLNRDVLRELVAERYGLEGVSLVAVDDTWSAMRFRPKAAGKMKR
jgi:hypothetical protein